MITKQEYKKAWNKYNQENVLWRFDRWLAKINKRREENKKKTTQKVTYKAKSLRD